MRNAELAILEEIRGLLLIQQQGHKDIMIQGSDILAQLKAAGASLAALESKYEAALASMSETLPAGHAAVLQSFAQPIEEIATRIAKLQEFEARIMALPVPIDPSATMPQALDR